MWEKDQGRVAVSPAVVGGEFFWTATVVVLRVSESSVYLRFVLLISQHKATMKINLGTRMRNTSSEIEDQIGVMMTLMPWSSFDLCPPISLSLSLSLSLSRSGSMQDINTTKIDFWYSKKNKKKISSIISYPWYLQPVK